MRWQVSAVPERLLERDEQKGIVMDFVKSAVQRQSKEHCLYITGMPGTGKTATVHECISKLQAQVGKGELQSFSYIEINGMRLQTPAHAYSVLWRGLRGEQLSPKAALPKLEAHFEQLRRSQYQNSNPVCVLLADELDWLLLQKQQQVVYNLVNWSLLVPGLVVIGIANALDLPQRISNRAGSRIGLQHLVFKPYVHEQIEVT